MSMNVATFEFLGPIVDPDASAYRAEAMLIRADAYAESSYNMAKIRGTRLAQADRLDAIARRLSFVSRQECEVAA